MTKDEIIKLAREAGIDVSLYDMGAASCVFSEGCHGVARDEFQRFASACYEAGRTAEREEAAKVCEAERRLGVDDERAYYGDLMAEAIRARGKT
jgi:predicted nucleic acid-binding protein